MESIATALKTGFTEVGTGLTGIIGDSLPIVLPVIGGVLAITVGIKIYQRVTNKV